MTWQIEAFDRARHDRTPFNSGSESLDRYLKERVNPHAKQGVSRTYVAVPQTDESDPPDPRPVQGFYTLSAGSIEFEEFPDGLTKRLPQYPVPIALIGQLAVDQTVQGQGLGGVLLVDAIDRVILIAEDMGVVAVAVHAKDEQSAAFYKHHGFTGFDDQPMKLVLPLATAREIF
jgi:GNAT superfamily N-acetyltransferase